MGPTGFGEGIVIARQAFRPALAVPEFRRLWVADLQSYLGDQLARVALAVLVYDRTHSGLATSVVYALTYLPALLGGLVLGGLADRFPRRTVLVASDSTRAVLLAAMALPGVSTPGIAILLSFSVLMGGLFNTAESAVVADIVEGEAFTAATGLRNVTGQVAQLLGFAVGGAAVAAFGTRPALLLDAATFVISAVVLRTGLRNRPAARSAGSDLGGPSAGRSGRLIWRTIQVLYAQPTLRHLLALAWVGGVFIVAEGLAAPFVRQHGGGPASTGLLLAAAPAGMALGSLLFIRHFGPRRRAVVAAPLAVLAALALVGYPLASAIPIAMILLFLNGFFSAYQVQVIAEFVPAVPAEIRGQAIGIGSSGLVAVQGVALLVGGLVAEAVGVTVAVSTAGLGCLLVALYLCVARSRARDDRGLSTR